MKARRCGTCKYYEQSPNWREGWCRNPLLHTPDEYHVVSDSELDCERGMGNFWEPAGARQHQEVDDSHHLTHDSNDRNEPSIPISAGGQPIYPVMGSSGYGGDPPPPSDQRGGQRWPDDRGDYGYYDDERYWTDYIRIAAPICGVLLLLVLLWFWFANWMDDDDGNAADVATNVPTTEVTPSETAQGTGTETGITLPTASGTATEANGGEGSATETTEGAGGVLANGASAEVAHTGGTGVNVRSAPTTDSEVLSVFLDGTPVTIVGESVEAEGFVWWPVSGEGVEEGYIVEDYLEPVQ